MNETGMQGNGTVSETQGSATVSTQTTQGQERTFTQAELDSIVKDRLHKESAKFADYEDLKAKAKKLDEMEEANKSEIQKATEKANALQAQLDQLQKAESIRKIREKVASEKGVPANLLTAETEELCTEQANAIMAFAGSQQYRPTYPNVKDNGETKAPTMTKEQVLAIKDPTQRLKAIQANIELF